LKRFSSQESRGGIKAKRSTRGGPDLTSTSTASAPEQEWDNAAAGRRRAGKRLNAGYFVGPASVSRWRRPRHISAGLPVPRPDNLQAALGWEFRGEEISQVERFPGALDCHLGGGGLAPWSRALRPQFSIGCADSTTARVQRTSNRPDPSDSANATIVLPISGSFLWCRGQTRLGSASVAAIVAAGDVPHSKSMESQSLNCRSRVLFWAPFTLPGNVQGNPASGCFP